MASWIDHQAIKRLNPQRYPLALLDRIEQQADGELVGVKAITATEPCYRFVRDDMDQTGLAYPSSLIAESFCQAAGPLCLSKGAVTLDQAHHQLMVIASMSDIVFLRQVFPGQVITHHPRLLATYSNAVLVGGETRQADEPIARFGGILVAWTERVRL